MGRQAIHDRAAKLRQKGRDKDAEIARLRAENETWLTYSSGQDTIIETLTARVAVLEAALEEVLDQEEYQLGKATLATINAALGGDDAK